MTGSFLGMPTALLAIAYALDRLSTQDVSFVKYTVSYIMHVIPIQIAAVTLGYQDSLQLHGQDEGGEIAY